jgi:hypothetical protein
MTGIRLGAALWTYWLRLKSRKKEILKSFDA